MLRVRMRVVMIRVRMGMLARLWQKWEITHFTLLSLSLSLSRCRGAGGAETGTRSWSEPQSDGCCDPLPGGGGGATSRSRSRFG